MMLSGDRAGAPSRVCAAALVFAVGTVLSPGAQTLAGSSLEIYVVDVEGGNATLFVAPSGESILIDSGNGGPAGAGPANAVRDAGRIMAAATDAGLTQIDHLITTHWHSDHYGGMAELAARIPIRHFIDHGANAPDDFARARADEFLEQTYPGLYGKARRTVVRPGDRVSVAGLDVLVVTSAGESIKTALAGAGQPNALCAAFTPGVNNAEDPLSVGTLVSFGQFRSIHLGDLTKNKEFELMCPNNRIGTVDVLLGLHHGVDSSNSEVLVHALRPRVAIMNNGTRKGGQPEVMKTVHTSPGLEDLWQVHFSELSGQEYSVPGMFIANMFDEPLVRMPVAPVSAPQPGSDAPPAPVHNGTAYWIKVSAQADGSFTVTNGRNGFSKTYAAGRRPRAQLGVRSDVADVMAAEVAFNAAQNAGNILEMAKHFLPGRTIYGPAGGGLAVGWTTEGLARRQAEFDAGRKVDYRIDKLEVQVYGDTAVATFERVGTIRDVDGRSRDSHLRISGVWMRVDGQWKLAHRHESPF